GKQLACRSNAVAQSLRASVHLLGRRRTESLACQQVRPERDVECDLTQGPLMRIGKPREQLQRASIMVYGFTCGAACAGIVASGTVVMNRARHIAPPLEMRGQLGGEFACPLAESCLESIGYRDMQTCTSRCRQTLIESRAIERMLKRIVTR